MVDNVNGSDVTGDGSSLLPFASLEPLNDTPSDPDGPGDVIFVKYGTSTYRMSGFELEVGQQLIGEGAGSAGQTLGDLLGGALSGVSLPVGGERPHLVVNETGIRLARDNSLRGVEVSVSGQSATGIAGADFGRLTMSQGSVGASGGARVVRLTDGVADVTLDRISSSNFTGSALTLIDLLRVSGAFSVLGNGAFSSLGSNHTGGTNLTFVAGSVGMRLTDYRADISLENMDFGRGQPVIATNQMGALLLSQITIDDASDGHGIEVINTDADLPIAEFQRIRFDENTQGNSGFFASFSGASDGVVKFIGCRFEGLDGDGVCVSNNGSGEVSASVTACRFLDAAAPGVDGAVRGSNGLNLALSGSGTLDFEVVGSSFRDVARAGASPGAINISTAGTGGAPSSRLTGVIDDNEFEQIGGRAIYALLEASGGTGHGGHDLRILNNDIQDTAAEGVSVVLSSIDGGRTLNNKIAITGNRIGNVIPVAAGGAQEGIEISASHSNGGPGAGAIEADILIARNNVRTNNSDRTLAIDNGADGGVGASTDLEISVHANTLSNTHPSGHSFELRNLDLGSSTSLDLNSAGGPFNIANRGYILDHRAGIFGLEIDEDHAVINTPGALHTDSETEAFLQPRNSGTITTPGDLNAFRADAEVTEP